MRERRWLYILAALAVGLSLAAQQTPPAGPSKTAPAKSADQRAPGLYMTLETDKGSIGCKLFEKEAPQTVRAVVGLAIGKKSYVDPRTHRRVNGKRFYDGLTFHRVIPDFMIQGGDALGNGTGDPGFTLPAEIRKELNFDVPGRLAMARLPDDINSASSQFFITEVPYPHLNQQYTILGQCANIDVVRTIARVPRNRENRPLTPVHIRRVLVERVGPVPPDAPEARPGGPSRKAAGKSPAKSSGKVPAKSPA